MESNEIDFSEEWIKMLEGDIPESEYVVTNFVQDIKGIKILLDEGNHRVEIIFDGIPVLVRSAVEGVRMRTWSNAQLKYDNKFLFRKSFLFEVRK